MSRFECNDCNDAYYITGKHIPGRIRSIVRCSCKGSRRYFFLEWLSTNKQYIQTAIQNEDVTMEEVIKILNNE